MAMNILGNRAANATWWSTLEILARYGVQFFVMVLLARLLTPQDFGLIAMLLVFTSIGAVLVDSGFGTALIQRQTPSADDETTVFIFTTGVSIAIAAILMLTAPAIASFFGQPKLVALTRVMALSLPLGAFAAVPDALLTMRLDFKARARAEVIASLCSGVVAIALAWQEFGVWSLAWQGLVAIGIRGLLLWVYSGWRPRGHFRSESFRSLFGFGGYMLLSGLLNTTGMRLQSLVIGKLFDSRALGYYTLAQNTQSAPVTFIGSVLNRVGLPVFSSVAHDRDKLLEALRMSLRMTMFLFVPCMLGIALVAKPLVELLYGARWASAAPILSILAASATLYPVHVLNLATISAQGRSDLFFRLEVIKQLAVIGLILVSSPGGPIAIAWGIFASGIVGAIVNTHYSKKLLGYGVMAQMTDQGATFVLSLPAACAGWAILHWTRPNPISMFGAVVISATIYVVLAVTTKNKALNGLISMVRALHTKKIPNKP
jgi:teichuronic acid exporter